MKKAQPNKETNNAIILTRVSTREQEEGYSIDAQLQRLRNYCSRKGLKCIKEFSIVESSTRGDRIQFQEMIQFVRHQKGSVAIVCDKVDRLQRSFRELPMLDELRRAGKISLHFNVEGQVLDKNSNSSQIMAYQMFIMMAESYTNSISDNVRRSFEQMRKEGKYGHYAPVGYLNSKDENNKATIIPDPDRGLLITKLFNECAKGIYTLEQLTRKAREWGFSTKKGKTVHKQTISNVLRNKFYCGVMTLKGVEYQHIYPPLIDKETWKICQDVLDGRMNHKIRKNEPLFQGMVHCARCGNLISTDVKYGKYNYLFCPKCGETRVNETKCIDEIKAVLYSLKNLPESYVKEAVKTLDAAINKDIKMEKEEQAALKRQITATESKKEQLLDLLLNKSITQDLYNKKYTSLCNEQEKMKHRLESYDLIVRKSLVTCKTLFLLANRAYELFESSKTEEKRRLIKILFSKLEIDGKNCLFSKRKAVETLLSTAFHQKWLERFCNSRTIFLYRNIKDFIKYISTNGRNIIE